jgi:hypothetical protein
MGAVPGNALRALRYRNTRVNGGSPRSTACAFATGLPPKRPVLMSIHMMLVSSPAKTVRSGLLHQSPCCFRVCEQVGGYRCGHWCAPRIRPETPIRARALKGADPPA